MLLFSELILSILKTCYPFKNPKEDWLNSIRLADCFARECGALLQYRVLLHEHTFFTQEKMAGVPIPKHNINFEDLVDEKSKKH